MVVNEDCYTDEHKNNAKIIDKFFHIFRYLVASASNETRSASQVLYFLSFYGLQNY